MPARRCRTETGAKYVVSGTNWLLGTPRWFDGNDIAGWSERQLEDVLQIGRVMARWLMTRPEVLIMNQGLPADSVSDRVRRAPATCHEFSTRAAVIDVVVP